MEVSEKILSLNIVFLLETLKYVIGKNSYTVKECVILKESWSRLKGGRVACIGLVYFGFYQLGVNLDILKKNQSQLKNWFHWSGLQASLWGYLLDC